MGDDHDRSSPDSEPRAQQEVLDSAASVAEGDDRILAAWVEGSLATHRADVYSDVDLHLLVREGDFLWFAENWRKVAEAISGPLVLAHDIPGVIGGYTLNREWTHVDMLIHDEAPTGARAAIVIFERENALAGFSPTSTSADEALSPHFPTHTVEFYFYLLGNLVVTFGRDELIVARGGIQALTDQWIMLLKAERGGNEVSGQKRLNAFLPAEQKAVVEGLPPAGTTRDGIVTAATYITRDVVTRGKALAERTGASWPTDLVAATGNHLRLHIGTDLGATNEPPDRPECD